MKEFKVGQIWKTNDGTLYRILETNFNSDTFPIRAESVGLPATRINHYTANGNYFEHADQVHPLNLSELISEPEEIKKEFKVGQMWCARNGTTYEITEIISHPDYPIRAKADGQSDYESFSFSATGKFYSRMDQKPHPKDLVRLLSLEIIPPVLVDPKIKNHLDVLEHLGKTSQNKRH
jgi:cytochrome b involved in lipid metabolism